MGANGHNFNGKKNPNWKGGKPVCEKCGGKISDYHVKLCRKCYDKERKITKNKPKCIDCGVEISSNVHRRCEKCYGLTRRTKDDKFCTKCGKKLHRHTPVNTGLCSDCWQEKRARTYYYQCQECGVKKNKSRKPLCQQCAIKKRPSMKGKNSPRYSSVKVNCDFCGKEKTVFKKELKLKHHFCDSNCFYKFNETHMKGENNPFYGKNHTEETKLKLIGERPHTRGENSAAWCGGISFSPYSPKWNKYLKEFVRQRDERICQLCGKTEYKNHVRLSVHHIDYDKLNCDPINLISLCSQCHTPTNMNREFWQKYFEEIMKIKME